VIIVHDEPRILSQTQRRRRYPKRQQCHCYDCFQPMHVKQKYNALLEIFKQFLKAGNAPLDIGHIVMTSVRMVSIARGPYTFMKRPSIRITFVIIALAAAVAVVIGDLARHAANRKLREAILAELQPVALKNCNLKRFGSVNDGGYLMCENLIEPLDEPDQEKR
jgi:hypothetical protein